MSELRLELTKDAEQAYKEVQAIRARKGRPAYTHPVQTYLGTKLFPNLSGRFGKVVEHLIDTSGLDLEEPDWMDDGHGGEPCSMRVLRILDKRERYEI